MGMVGGGVSKKFLEDNYVTIDGSVPKLVTGTAAPGETDVPEFVGEVYIDTTNHKVYVADATDANTDYLVLN